MNLNCHRSTVYKGFFDEAQLSKITFFWSFLTNIILSLQLLMVLISLYRTNTIHHKFQGEKIYNVQTKIDFISALFILKKCQILCNRFFTMTDICRIEFCFLKQKAYNQNKLSFEDCRAFYAATCGVLCLFDRVISKASIIVDLTLYMLKNSKKCYLWKLCIINKSFVSCDKWQ